MEQVPSASESPRIAPGQLFASEEMLRVFFDLASVGMVFVSPDGTLAAVNQAYARITGYAPEELVGRPVLDMTHPDDRQTDRTHFEAYLRGQYPLYSADKRYLRKDGTLRWVEVHARLVHHMDGTPRFSIGIIEDITDRKLAEQALRQSEARRQINEILEKTVAERTAELREANEELTRFNRAAVNRELRMIELKKQVNRLCIQAGQTPPYTLPAEERT
jgi:PAS domain S-box-containing protein